MANIVPVDRNRHAGKGWRHPTGYQFAQKDAVVSIVASEFPQAALALPIGFVEQSGFFVSVMLTSPIPGRNAAIGPQGEWFVGYTPLCYAPTRSHLWRAAPASSASSALHSSPAGRSSSCPRRTRR